MTDLARELGCHVETIRRVESASTAPRIGLLFEICRAFDCSMEAITGDPLEGA